MDQGIAWGPDAKPYSVWDKRTLASHQAYAGQVVNYRASKHLLKGKERAPKTMGIKDYTKKKTDKGPPSINSYTQSEDPSKGTSPTKTPSGGDKPPQGQPSGGGPPGSGPPGCGGRGGGDPGRRPPDHQDNPRGAPPGRGGAGGSPG